MAQLRTLQRLCMLAFFVWPTVSQAEEPLEVWWAKTPPSIEEISGGKLKLGDKITKDTVEHVKDYMLHALYRDTLDGAEWEIAPYTPGEELMPHGLLKATKGNLEKAVISPTGTVRMADGSAWIGGFPIPEAKTGLDVMVNRQFRWTDAQADLAKGHWVNSDGEIYKNNVSGFLTMNMTGRVSMDPRPAYPGYEDQLSRTLWFFEDPYELKGTKILLVIYVDQDKYPDAWLYEPVQRRLIRLSSGQRYDSVDGSLIRTGDIDGFSDPLGLWTFELVDRKFLFTTIVGTTQAGGFRPLEEPPDFIKGGKTIYVAGARVALRDTFIVDAAPKTDHIYSKKRLYIDAATYLTGTGEFYVQEDELREAHSMFYQRGQNDYGSFAALTWIQARNYANNQATLFHEAYYVRNPPENLINVRMLTLKYIQTQSR